MGDNVDSVLGEWIATATYGAMEWTDMYWWPIWSVFVFIGCLIAMAPLKTHHEQSFIEIIFVYVRKSILWLSVVMLLLPFALLFGYDSSMQNQMDSSRSIQAFIDWFVSLAKQNWFAPVSAAVVGLIIRFTLHRYALPYWSKLFRSIRHSQSDDVPTDIREEAGRFQAKDFIPGKYYKKGKVLVGLDRKSKPIHVPLNTWYETNMQVVGPTRYGKGVVLGCLMDQSIKRGDTLFYIDPKEDRFAPHVMYQAAMKAGRKFYYVSLHDGNIGSWAPFAGGSKRDAYARLESAFGLEMTGDPGTDYYKSQESRDLQAAFNKSQNIRALANLLEDSDANRVTAELNRWSAIESLCPKNKGGFSIEKALKENAVVYVQGHLDDTVVKSATKVFISELIQEARRLKNERTAHLTTVIDEVSFLTSKILAQSMATAVGFRVNFVLAYQSQNDLLNLDDKSVNPRYIHNSINVNCQLKAIYGGADFETAEAAANLSGTISKEVTRMERTNVSDAGGETWENQRYIGSAEENYINTNMILTLPPRVCVFIQPNRLMEVAFTSFVPVKDMGALESFIENKKAPPAPLTTKQSPQAERSTVDDSFVEDQAVSLAKQPETTTPETTSANKSQETDGRTTQSLTEEESERKRKNRERRKRQKEKKKADEKDHPQDSDDNPSSDKKEPVSLAKQEAETNPMQVQPVEPFGGFEPFGEESVQSDRETLKALEGLDDDD